MTVSYCKCFTKRCNAISDRVMLPTVAHCSVSGFATAPLESTVLKTLVYGHHVKQGWTMPLLELHSTPGLIRIVLDRGLYGFF